mgnify:FL=1
MALLKNIQWYIDDTILLKNYQKNIFQCKILAGSQPPIIKSGICVKEHGKVKNVPNVQVCILRKFCNSIKFKKFNDVAIFALLYK